MAEFTKVAHEWVRMCKAYSDAGDCMKCPIVTNPICGCMSDDNGASDKDISKAEADIMSWAAEHPEPKYPTWWKYMCMIGVIPDELGNKTLGEMTVYSLMNTHIQSDTAEKLGLKPKEG